MAEFIGDPGSIYTERNPDDDKPWNVWFEDFCILGDGNTESEALEAALRQTNDIATLINEAIKITKDREAADAQSKLTTNPNQLNGPTGGRVSTMWRC